MTRIISQVVLEPIARPYPPASQQPRSAKMAHTTAYLCFALVLTACLPEPAHPPSSSRAEKRQNKEDIFGDPALMPTRVGERARLEVALGTEIESAIADLGYDVRAAVTLPTSCALSPKVLVRYRSTMNGGTAIASLVPGDPTMDAVLSTLRSAAAAIVPAASSEDITVLVASRISAAATTPPPRARLSIATGLALLAFGLSLGVAAERWYRSQRRRQKQAKNSS